MARSAIKEVHFVSWKKHKVALALSQVDSICDGFIDDVIFETVLDACRERAFPRPDPLSEILDPNVVGPQWPYEKDQRFDTGEIRRQQKCPVCHETVDAGRFTSHLAGRCFSNSKPLEVSLKFFEDELAGKAPE
jgi:hypothetical protein